MFEKFKKIHRKYKLRYKMIFANLLISIVPIILIAGIFYNVFLDTIESYVSDSVELYFNQVGHRLEEYLNTVNIVADSVFLDKNLQELIISEQVSYWDKHNQVDEFFQSYLKFYEYFTDIYLLDRPQNIYHSRSVVVRDEFKDFITGIDIDQIEDGKLYIKGPLKLKEGETYFIAYRLIKSVFFENFLEDIALGAVILDGNHILSIIEENNLPEGSSVYIQDKDGVIITSTDNKEIESGMNYQFDPSIDEKYTNINNVNYIVKSSGLSSELNTAGWTIRALINRDKLIEESNVIKYTIMIILLLVFLIVVVVTLIFNYRLTYPLKKMADAFDRVATGDFNYKLKFQYKNEITNIEDNFNNMIRELESLTNRLLMSQKEAHQIELEKKQFQLDGLQSQINAHFLYNTLNTIRVMAHTDAKKEVDAMIRNLVNYLRYISKINEFVTLKDELRQLEKYKNIEQMRFGNRFKIRYKIEPGIEKIKIIKLTIQPIVENAIFHGMRKMSGNGVIQISAFKDGERLTVRIMDSGKGIKKTELNEINKGINSDKVKNSNGSSLGIGLVNIHKRIQIYFGNQYGLTVKSWQNIGTVVTITYPYEKEEGKDNV